MRRVCFFLQSVYHMYPIFLRCKSTFFDALSRPVSIVGIVTAYRSANCLRSEEHTSELQSLMRISYAVCCLKKTIHAQSRTSPARLHLRTPHYYILLYFR